MKFKVNIEFEADEKWLKAFLDSLPNPEGQLREIPGLTVLSLEQDIEKTAHEVKESKESRPSKRIYGKLDPEKVEKIKRRIMQGEKLNSIAEDFGCSITNIRLIKKGKIWTEVPWPATEDEPEPPKAEPPTNESPTKLSFLESIADKEIFIGPFPGIEDNERFMNVTKICTLARQQGIYAASAESEMIYSNLQGLYYNHFKSKE